MMVNPFYVLMNAKRFVTNTLQKSPELFLENEFNEKEDPWGYDTSAYEKERFKKTLSLLQSIPHKSILEIGCAEGHFTKMLTTISNDVTAIDLSATAIKRAKKRSPNATYIHQNLVDTKKFNKIFDVIICSEILYYIDKKQQAIDTMANYTKYILTSNAGVFALAVDPYFSKMQLITKINHVNIKEKKMTKIALWKVT